MTAAVGVFALAMAAGPSEASAQSAEDSAAVRATALDYIEGWYTGDAERMERSLHPQVAKRIVHIDPVTGSSLVATSALELVGQVRAGGGSGAPPEERRTDARVLDIFEDAASVRVDAGGWIDYLHLARFGDRWLIVNVLWEWRGEGPW
ncbi:MAG: nuclear transport factor 2 family protein [Myxococcota bacterium]